MGRRFSDAEALLSHLLDRREDGIADPTARPDFSPLDNVSEIDCFVRRLEEAESAGAIRIVKGKGRDSDQIKLVRLQDTVRLYDLLERRPVAELAVAATERLRDGLDVPDALAPSIAAISAQWERGRPWQGFAAADVDRLRTALMLATAILHDKHKGTDYRTFSRKIAGDSKALERLEGAVVRLLGLTLELPPGARPRDALRTLGLEKFAPPLLLAGRLDFDSAELSLIRPAYFGIPPQEASRIRLHETPRYVLTIENYASFHRHIAEADRDSMGVTIFVGGYPSLATQGALRALAGLVPGNVPFFHWSDIDPDGTWIFRTIERIIARPLRPHLMTPELAEVFGRSPDDPSRPPRQVENTAIAALTTYLSSEGAKWLEQEELDPAMPV
ncbi:Wadjet anti-phage system protein JetD domain-containing protein [Bradyrhizobium sp. HKCCYLS1011]|uniref:Wadjet anti-phage system protein JetD domain-containing protein n=1 Tax=Bradyrhizobium sp. HKCCYLS1011 TaxID=3420733 RepID=UPI003EBCE3CF